MTVGVTASGTGRGKRGQPNDTTTGGAANPKLERSSRASVVRLGVRKPQNWKFARALSGMRCQESETIAEAKAELRAELTDSQEALKDSKLKIKALEAHLTIRTESSS